MSNFFRDVVSKLLKADFEGHTKFSVADNKAVGENPVRTLSLDAVPVGDEVLVSLAWEGGDKLFEKKFSPEEAQHQFSIISNDLAEAVALTQKNEYDAAKSIMETLSQKYSENTGDIVPTNLPPVNTTQGALEDKLWREAKITMQNLFFSNTDELMEFQKKMKELQPGDQDGIPLWDKMKGEESKEQLSAPSLSYEQVEKNQAKDTKNLDKRIKETVKTELESQLEEKKATMFTDNDKKLVDGMRGVGRNWDEIKKYMVKELDYDKESVDLYIDDLRSKEDGTPHEMAPEPSVPRPPKEVVSPETHDKLVQDIKEKKEHKPVEEVKEKEIEKVDTPIKEESAKKPMACGECDGEGSVPSVRGGRVIAITCPTCKGDTHISTVDKSVESASNEIARMDNTEIDKVATQIPTKVKLELQKDISNSMYRMNAPGAKYYRFSLDGNKIYRGEYTWDLNDFGPYQFIYNMETGEIKENSGYKPTAFASLKKQADDLNPLQTPPVTEAPTLPTQDAIPFEKSQSDHDAPKHGDRVFVTGDMGDEKAGFEGEFISDFMSDGTKMSIVLNDRGEEVQVESHRVVKTSEGSVPAQEADPIQEPHVETLKNEDISITPSLAKLTSSKHDECSDKSGTGHAGPIVEHTSGTSSKKYCDKHLPTHIKYNKPEPKASLKEADEAADERRFERAVDALDKKLMRGDIHQEEYDAAYAKLKKEIFPNENLIKAEKHTKCVKCDKSLPVKDMVENVHGAGYLCKEHAKDWNKDSSKDSLLSIKAEAEALLKEIKELGKTSFLFIKKGLEKHADDSAFEGNGWCRVWIQEDEIAADSRYPEILKMPDEAARIVALKDLAREMAHEALRLADSAGAKVGVQSWFESLKPSDHDRIDWVKLATPQTAESSLKEAAFGDKRDYKKIDIYVDGTYKASTTWSATCAEAKQHYMEAHPDAKNVSCRFADEKKAMGPNALFECTNCKAPMGPFEQSHHELDENDEDVWHCNDKKADETAVEEVPTKLKDVKITPDKVDKSLAVPATDEQAQVIQRMQHIEANLKTLDMAKEEVTAKLKAELQKIDNAGERSALEAEYKAQIEKLAVLINAVGSKVIKYNDMFLTFQQEEKTIAPKIDYKDILERVAKKFEGVDKLVQNIINGMQSLAKSVTTKTITRWPEKRSALTKHASSVSEQLAAINDEMLLVLQTLSTPL